MASYLISFNICVWNKWEVDEEVALEFSCVEMIWDYSFVFRA